ncbi:MAG: 2-keto-D-gluconate dehydrogenase [Gammaproteobacteria bacterium HGW-Gammaproteobacteria-4]|jgi:5-methylcytosine-specific restriction enzyme subunit McrC|nr:MAG: 2-keto-D-gluconate dehydrogenase [Gammaproteobacteria bacterium HGW-Gammaproteobacteria-4]
MSGITIYEFDALVAEAPACAVGEGAHAIPAHVFDWLERRCLSVAEDCDAPWLRFSRRSGRRAIQVTSFVGVIRAPDGFQIEVLPKVGRAMDGGDVVARQLLIDMLRCLHGFRHIQTDSAKLLARRMPLLEVFIAEFLRTVAQLVKRGLRGDYSAREENLFALRGKLLVAQHLRQNRCRADRFYTARHEFSIDRPENRLLHAALRSVLQQSASPANQQLAREVEFAFADVPASEHPRVDFQQVRLDRGMGLYADALAWARLILDAQAPLPGNGRHNAPSLLFPMEAVFEAFVTEHLALQVARPRMLKAQARSHHLVRHCEQHWFWMKPDLLIRDADHDVLLVLDTKWKLLDGLKANGADKYGLSQADFYQLHAYGHSYLHGAGDVVLIYPRTDRLTEALPVFDFTGGSELRLWVLPFCLTSRKLCLPDDAPFLPCFCSGSHASGRYADGVNDRQHHGVLESLA